jgi:hypothetical protein
MPANAISGGSMTSSGELPVAACCPQRVQNGVIGSLCCIVRDVRASLSPHARVV